MEVHTRTLRLANPWRIAHGTTTSRTNVFIDIGDGIGEAPIVPYYPYDERTVMDWLLRVAPRIPDEAEDSPELFIAALEDAPPPAVSALDMALHDRWARRHGKPLFQMWSLDAATLPRTSITLAIPEDDAALLDMLERLDSWPILKLKLGTGDPDRDVHLVRLARKHTEATLCVDANGAWDVDTAARVIPMLANEGVVFVEEPVRGRDPEVWKRLRKRLGRDSIPILADESVQTAADAVLLAPFVDGYNVKLAKNGGFTGARRVIEAAREYDRTVLLGCMVESSLGVTAAAHLAPLAHYADLDGHLQIDNDPFSGAQVIRGELTLPDGPGLGVAAVDSTA